MHYYPTTVLVVSWLFWLWESYLDYRQYRVFKTTEKVPKQLEKHIDHETFLKSKSYSIDKSRFGFLSSFLNQVDNSLVVCYYLAYFWNLSGSIMSKQFGFSKSESLEWEIFQSLVFIFITSLASTIINLPISIYSTFVIEQKHGFNKQTWAFFAWDKFKMFIVSYLITAPVVAVMVYIVRNGGPYFFLYLWMFLFTVVCVLIFFHGEIQALFDKFTPLPPGELRDKIEKIASEVNFPFKNIMVVEGSKRSTHSNAYLGGILNRRKIVIYDTLIEGYYDDKEEPSSAAKKEDQDKKDSIEEGSKKRKGCTTEEILAVLCHELGHWNHGHMIKNLIFIEVNYFIMFLIFSKFYNDPVLYSSFGFAAGEMPSIIGLALLMLILTPYSELQGFISTAMSRYFEYQADEYAAKRGHSEKLKTALVKLSIDNLGFPVHDELYSKFNHSHPTIIQRLAALDKHD